ncbi:MAG: bifunctional pyr operon transcriptional regulator/uracil phosphoribosyltransferase PyrR [Micavibrio sp.]|nr:bifunctional pyr operon transcriptional regulator/uracil phosphoribosyltransferase PyrR [Micavibrio sp.]
MKSVLDSPSIDRAIIRMAHEIIEKNKNSDELCLVGIQRRGVILAQRLKKTLEELCKTTIPLGILDINLYRDDLTSVADQPIIHKTEIPFDLTKKIVVLVDDVLYTGRTVRSAFDAMMDFGRPKRIELAVLIDRGHRELPIRADFVGKNIPTSEEEIVHVCFKETDGKEEVVVSHD